MPKGSISDTVSLVIQGNDGTNDWYYSKKIDKTDTVKISDIQRALNISDDIDWRNCQIWLETTDEDRMTYAVPAEVSTVFATKDQLMDSVLHYDGTPDSIGNASLCCPNISVLKVIVHRPYILILSVNPQSHRRTLFDCAIHRRIRSSCRG